MKKPARVNLVASIELGKVQTGTGIVDPAWKFKCTTAVHAIFWNSFRIYECFEFMKCPQIWKDIFHIIDQSQRFKSFESSRNSLNPGLRLNLRPNSDDSLYHVIDRCKLFNSTYGVRPIVNKTYFVGFSGVIRVWRISLNVESCLNQILESANFNHEKILNSIELELKETKTSKSFKRKDLVR